MNQADVVAKVSEMTGIDKAVCESVIKALEKVLQSELSSSKGLGGALDKVTGLLNFLNTKKD